VGAAKQGSAPVGQYKHICDDVRDVLKGICFLEISLRSDLERTEGNDQEEDCLADGHTGRNFVKSKKSIKKMRVVAINYNSAAKLQQVVKAFKINYFCLQIKFL
jgi:hypothetical protein